MSGEWPKMSLRNAGVTLLDCEHRTPPDAGTGYPYIAIPQVKQGRLELADVRRITEDHFKEWTRKARPQVFDVILSRRCNPGETAVVPMGLECALGQNLVLLRADGSRVHPPFLRWLVRGPEWWEQIGKFLNVGAVFDSLKCADVPRFELSIPPLPIQYRIADILGSLDDKIEVNRRTNETLETMARTLFRSWFVDFNPVRAKADGRRPHGLDAATAALFPAAFEDSPLGLIPKGWRVTKLSEVTTKIGSGATPRGGREVYVDEGIAFIRSQNVYDHFFNWEGLARISESSAHELRGVTVHPDDILFNITGDSILRTCVVEAACLPARVSQHVAIIRPGTKVPSRFLHLHLVRQQTKDYLSGLDAGGTRKAVTKGHLESVPLLLPSEELLSRFDGVTRPMFERIDHNRSESRTLAALRDGLLPKLLSGELPVSDAARRLEAC